MASVYVIEIDGWGEVGPAINVTNAEGFADGSFTLTTGGTPPASDEIGAMIWVQGCDSVIGDGYYTLTAVGGSTFTMQADPAEVTVTSYSPSSGLARIEDHYKISDSLPSWVTGANARARWFRDLIGVSESAGQRVPALGGISTVDGFEFTRARRAGLAAVLADTYLLDSNGPVVLSESLDSSAATIITESAVPYAGESLSSPSGTAQPAWVGTEAIDVRGTLTSSDTTGGVTAYTMTDNGLTTFVTRGVLRTVVRSHAKGVAVFGTIPTPIGQVARAYVYDDGHASHADRTPVAAGVCELVDPSVGECSAETIACASYLISGRRKTDLDVARAFVDPGTDWYTDGDSPTRVLSQNGSEWGYILVGGIVAIPMTRVGSGPITIDRNGVEEWSYTLNGTVATRSDTPLVRPAESVAAWMAATRVSGDSLDLFSDDGEGRAGIVVTIDGNYTWLAPGWWPLCHVFYPITWPRSFNSEDGRGSPDIRWVQVNPVDAILSIITSTGRGDNGDHDTAPEAFGFGIDLDAVDVASFTTIGNRLEREGINAGSIALLTTEDESLRDRLESLCQMYGLAIVTTTDGKVRLADMAAVDYDTPSTLDEGDLVSPATFSIGIGEAVNSITLKYARPWARYDDADRDITQVIQATTGGVLETLSRTIGKAAKVEGWFGASVDEVSEAALWERWAFKIAQTNGVVGTITAEVDPGYSGQIGDTVAVTLPAFPNAQDSGAMSGALCRIVDRVHVSRPVGRASDVLTLHAYGVTADDKPRQWAPSGVVSSVTSKLIFDLEATTYSGGTNYDSDAVSFADGVDVDIYTTNWSLRSTTTPGTVASTAGNTVTLSVAAAGGGGDVTPNVGDKITLAGEQNQSVSEAAKWAWLSASTPGYLWR